MGVFLPDKFFLGTLKGEYAEKIRKWNANYNEIVFVEDCTITEDTIVVGVYYDFEEIGEISCIIVSEDK